MFEHTVHQLRIGLRGVDDPVHSLQVKNRCCSVPTSHVDMDPSCRIVEAIDEPPPPLLAGRLCGPRWDAIFH